MAPPRLVLFDAVGTLLHPEPHVADAYLVAGQRWGSQRDRATVAERFRAALRRYGGEAIVPSYDGRPAQRQRAARGVTNERRERQRWQAIVSYVFDDVPQHGRAIYEQLWQHFADPRHWRLDAELATVWRELGHRGYALGIASNFDERLVAVCEGHPPLGSTSHLYYSSQLGFVKPDVRFYRAIERRAGFRPDEILIVGDDLLHDVQAPRSAGWQSLLLDPLPQSEPTAVPADVPRIARLADLLSLL